MHQLSFTDDITANFHGGNEQSVAANPPKETKEATCRRILEAIHEAGKWGLSCDELATKWGVPNHTLSPRFSDLKRENAIVQVATRKTSRGKSAGVFVIKKD